MGKWGVLGAALVAGASLVRGANNAAVWRQVAKLPPAGADSQSVTVIVAARDEEATLDACLTALRAQDYPNVRIVVVDDASTDRTAEIARRHGVRLVSSDGPPAGWAGKVHAMHLGAAEADGEWLLFVDADIVVEPDVVGRLLAAARKNAADLISTSGQARKPGSAWWFLLPPTNVLLFEGTSPEGRAGRKALAVGHVILVSHEAYDHAGGWSALASTRADDVGFATLVRDSGRRTQYVDARGSVFTSGLDTFATSWKSLRKSTFAGVDEQVDGPAAVFGVLAAGGAGHVVYGLAPIAAVVAGVRGGSKALVVLGALGWLGQAVAHWNYVRRVDQPAASAVLAPLATAGMGVLLLDGAAHALRGGVTWKGRDVSG
jgi:hypothetical protein